MPALQETTKWAAVKMCEAQISKVQFGLWNAIADVFISDLEKMK